MNMGCWSVVILAKSIASICLPHFLSSGVGQQPCTHTSYKTQEMEWQEVGEPGEQWSLKFHGSIILRQLIWHLPVWLLLS